jgi:hypothetical protein
VQTLISNDLLDPVIAQRVALALNRDVDDVNSPEVMMQEHRGQTLAKTGGTGGTWAESMRGNQRSRVEQRTLQSQSGKEYDLHKHIASYKAQEQDSDPSWHGCARSTRPQDSKSTYVVKGAAVGPSSYASHGPMADVLSRPERSLRRSMINISDERVAVSEARGSTLSALLTSLSGRRDEAGEQVPLG